MKRTSLVLGLDERKQRLLSGVTSRPGLLLALLLTLGDTSTAKEPPATLTQAQQAVFCGHSGHEEATGSFSSAVLKELQRREGQGKSTREALADMRRDYCGAGQ